MHYNMTKIITRKIKQDAPIDQVQLFNRIALIAFLSFYTLSANPTIAKPQINSVERWNLTVGKNNLRYQVYLEHIQPPHIGEYEDIRGFIQNNKGIKAFPI